MSNEIDNEDPDTLDTLENDYYVHPQGGKIIVERATNTLHAWGSNGKKKKTSATPLKLALGHGKWTRSGPFMPPSPNKKEEPTL